MYKQLVFFIPLLILISAPLHAYTHAPTGSWEYDPPITAVSFTSPSGTILSAHDDISLAPGVKYVMTFWFDDDWNPNTPPVKDDVFPWVGMMLRASGGELQPEPIYYTVNDIEWTAPADNGPVLFAADIFCNCDHPTVHYFKTFTVRVGEKMEPPLTEDVVAVVEFQSWMTDEQIWVIADTLPAAGIHTIRSWRTDYWALIIDPLVDPEDAVREITWWPEVVSAVLHDKTEIEAEQASPPESNENP